ncbi:aminoglycoside phosphotransferase family protein [Streptomyces sp. NBC_00237]|uniref:phosphotransferase n=1 Tax=Streptomyces sp. NBC_00237 TaxID=2975687 RepID=UPI0022536348|nr:phosphotransferase [Streptomyces sp. NBC_00237]MCX5202326.1 aminoglycoside phosphotransferase family protein [Streptomyces sp. NBC_00237]
METPSSQLSAPPARGVRLAWHALPDAVRAHVEADILGSQVVGATTQPGGFSPGVAARLTCADGTRAFVKAVSADANPHSPKLHRREARNTAALPPGVPAPRLLGTYDDGHWVVLVLEDVDGVQPRVPWRRDELDRVLAALADLSAALTPAPYDAPRTEDADAKTFRGWQQRLESGETEGLDPWVAANLTRLVELAAPWAEFAHGDTLCHGDLRADNILLTADGGAVFVDWPHAVRAVAWFELLVMLPSVAAQGGGDPEELFAAHPSAADADPAGVTCVLAALAGYFVHHSLLPAPPGLPTVRPFQAAQGAAAVAWLRRRLGEGE